MTPWASNGGEKAGKKCRTPEQSPEKSLRGRHGQTSASGNVLPARTRRLTSSPQHAGASTAGAAPRATGDSHAERRSTWSSSSETEQSSVAASGYPERAKNPRAAAGCFKCAGGAPPLSQGLSRMCAGTLRSGPVMRRLRHLGRRPGSRRHLLSLAGNKDGGARTRTCAKTCKFDRYRRRRRHI